MNSSKTFCTVIFLTKQSDDVLDFWLLTTSYNLLHFLMMLKLLMVPGRQSSAVRETWKHGGVGDRYAQLINCCFFLHVQMMSWKQSKLPRRFLSLILLIFILSLPKFSSKRRAFFLSCWVNTINTWFNSYINYRDNAFNVQWRTHDISYFKIVSTKHCTKIDKISWCKSSSSRHEQSVPTLHRHNQFSFHY